MAESRSISNIENSCTDSDDHEDSNQSDNVKSNVLKPFLIKSTHKGWELKTVPRGKRVTLIRKSYYNYKDTIADTRTNKAKTNKKGKPLDIFSWIAKKLSCNVH